MPPITFHCDLRTEPVPFDHYFEHTVGSCHATMALRADYQQQLKRCHEELGFRHVRFHGLLGDDMGTLMEEIGQLVYSFFNTDQIFDFLLSIGMKPFVELSFMPSCLSSGDTIVFHYKGNVTPPRDYAAWGTLITKLVTHWVDRYGLPEVESWLFEVWNEPNLYAFWTGTQQDYFKLYETTARAIKQVAPQLQVGGPATAANAWIPDFLDFCRKNDAPVDFVSTHHYPTDAFGQPGDDTITQLSKGYRSALRDQVAKSRSEAGTLPLYYTEWNVTSNPFDPLHDMPMASAFITKTVIEGNGYTQGYSWWTFSDIFEENYFSSQPFHGGFGLVNIYGVPKPAYRAFQLLHQLGDKMYKTEGTHATVDVWVFRKDAQVQVMVCNSSLPLHPLKEEEVEIRLTGIANYTDAELVRIDALHCNTRQGWEDMGQPLSLSPAQVKTLEEISLLRPEPLPVRAEGDELIVTLQMPANGVACITLSAHA